MGLLKDEKILLLCEEEGMIFPYYDQQVCYHDNTKVISYGISSYGYDIRCSDEFSVFPNSPLPIDPKNAEDLNVVRADTFDIPPGAMCLTRSVEQFKIPENCLGIAVGKSTYARCGIIVNITPLEPGWEGYLTIELSNTNSRPARVYANEGIAQILFFKGKSCFTSYADRKGKYQNQGPEIVKARL